MLISVGMMYRRFDVDVRRQFGQLVMQDAGRGNVGSRHVMFIMDEDYLFGIDHRTMKKISFLDIFSYSVSSVLQQPAPH